MPACFYIIKTFCAQINFFPHFIPRETSWVERIIFAAADGWWDFALMLSRLCRRDGPQRFDAGGNLSAKQRQQNRLRGWASAKSCRTSGIACSVCVCVCWLRTDYDGWTYGYRRPHKGRIWDLYSAGRRIFILQLQLKEVWNFCLIFVFFKTKVIIQNKYYIALNIPEINTVLGNVKNAVLIASSYLNLL